MVPRSGGRITVSRYPRATWKPLVRHSYPGKLERRRQIILHITDGPSEVSAFNQFQASSGSGATSAHFCIEQDGSVFQYVDLEDSAYHASGVNDISVGIEHVAMTQRAASYYNGLDHGNRVETPATALQYQASATLVCWLCKLLSIPPNRRNIREHCEASPADNHPWCCHAELNPDTIVAMASRQFSASTPAEERVLIAMGPGAPWLTIIQVNERVRPFPGDFVPSIEASLRKLNAAGKVALMEQHGRILRAMRSP